MLFKTFKPPAVSVSIETAKNSFVLGETITGSVVVQSDDEVEAKEVRVELLGVEKVTGSEEVVEEPVPETLETRLYSSEETYTQRGNETEYPMYKGQTRLCEKLVLTRGFSQSFTFEIAIPSDLGPSFRGQRHDGSWLERTWMVKSVVAVGGRPDVRAEKEITAQSPSVYAQPVTAYLQYSQPPLQANAQVACKYCRFMIVQASSVCPNCGARQ